MSKPSSGSLLELRPDLFREWHPTKNGSLSPRDARADSDTEVYWLCAQGHWWRARIRDRVNGLPCSYCRELQEKGMIRMASAMPQLLKEWHPSKNQGLRAQDVLANHRSAVWWVCQLGHEWLDTIPSRLNGNSCPACGSRQGALANALPAERESTLPVTAEGPDAAFAWETAPLQGSENDYAGEEKRRSPRYMVVSTVMIESAADEIYGYAELSNHSAGGLQITADFPLRAPAEASVRLASPFRASPQSLDCRVVWCRRLDAQDTPSRFTIGLAVRT